MPVSKADIQKRLDDMHSKMKKDIKSTFDYMTDDVKFFPPHYNAVSGKAEVEKFHLARKEKMAGADVDLKFTVTDVLELGDAVIADGTMVVTIGGKEVDNGKFLHVFKKVGNDYKIIRMMANTSKPREGGP